MKLTLIIITLLLITACGGGSKPQPPPLPTAAPTAEPTAEPTLEPTPEPTAEPTREPTPVPTATPRPTAQPTATPSPLIPVAWATPYPVPVIDPSTYIPPRKRQGVTVRLTAEPGEDYAAKIQAAQDNIENGTVIITGGSLKRSIILRTHTTKIESTPESPLSCDQVEGIPPYDKIIPHSNYGCILLEDGVHVEGTYRSPQQLINFFKFGSGSNPNDPYLLALQAMTDDQIAGQGSVILEPTFNLGPSLPGIEVFQALGDVMGSHTGRAENIAVTGIVIKGRQQMYDGGVRSTVLLGNCHHCTVHDVFLRDTGSIGVTAGGSGLETNNYANDVVFTRIITSGVAAANIAGINVEKFYVFNNYARRPGRKGFGGGISAIDIETNTSADHTKNVYIYNNLADYEGASQDGAGSAFVVQDPYAGVNHGGEIVVANNWAIGGRGEHSDYRYMSNGIYLVGLKQCKVINNYVFRTGQNAIQAYKLDGCLIQDNDFEHTGGGGSSTGHFIGVRNTTVRRSHVRLRPNLEINAQGGWAQTQGSCGNVFIDNLTQGILIPTESVPCSTVKER